jgi:hypothetical protein
VANAKKQLAASRRAFRSWLLADAGCKTLLAVFAIFLASRRPWRRLTRRHLRLAVALAAVDGVLALLAIVGAEYVRRFRDADSSLSDGIAAGLVLVPGLVGVAFAVGFAGSVRGRRGLLLGAVCGILGSLAASVSLIHHFGLYGLLPS